MIFARVTHIHPEHIYFGFYPRFEGFFKSPLGAELKDVVNGIRLLAKVGRPTVEQIKLIGVGMTAAQPAGLTVFRRRRVFDLRGPAWFFLSGPCEKRRGGKNTQLASLSPPARTRL